MKYLFWRVILAAAILSCATSYGWADDPVKEAAAAETTGETGSLGLADLIPEVVAVVNGKPISRDQLAAMAIGVYGRQALETLISQELVRQEAARQGVTATQEELDAYVQERVAEQLEALARTSGFENLDGLGKVLEQRGGSVEKLREEATDRFWPFAGPELIARKLVREGITVSDDEVRAEFDRRHGPKARALQIVLRTREEAEEVLKKLKMGADFVELARRISIDPISRRNDGELPLLPKSSRLGEAAFRLKPGELSEVIEMANVFHVLKVLELLPADEGVNFDDAKQQLRGEVIERRTNLEQQQWLGELIRKADIQRNL